MKVIHLVSNEVLFLYQDSAGNPIDSGANLEPATLYHCRRFTQASGYSTVDFYGAEVQPL